VVITKFLRSHDARSPGTGDRASTGLLGLLATLHAAARAMPVPGGTRRILSRTEADLKRL